MKQPYTVVGLFNEGSFCELVNADSPQNAAQAALKKYKGGEVISVFAGSHRDLHGPVQLPREDEYVAKGGVACPFCGAPDIESGPLEADGPVATAAVECQKCHRTWTDVFRLVDVILEEKR
jgi:alkyl hydroperoxide reductase subunit AhpF